MTDMQTVNPFELILSRLDQLQTSVNNLADNGQKTQSSQSANPGRLLDLQEAAEIMRKPVGTVRQYIHSRNLPATKIGKSYLIKLGDMLHWVDQFNHAKATKADPTDRMIENRKRYRKN